MTKAEERASELHILMWDTPFYNGFTKGYEQAEKDLELGWEDISIIRQIMFDYNRQIRNEMSIPNDKEYCEEILKRFKAMKETKD